MTADKLEIVLATKNADKLAEMAAILRAIAPGLTFVEADWPDVEETGATLEENALLKATAVAESTGCLALADDSGLEVDALGGEPGVRSARFAGPHATYADNNALLMQRMQGVEDRAARFRCVIAIVGERPCPAREICASDHHVWETVSGSIEGMLLATPRGDHGFGYDPLFVPTGWTESFAQASPEEKAAISHRGKALQAAGQLLNQLRGDLR